MNVCMVMHVCVHIYLLAGENVKSAIFNITLGDNASIYILYICSMWHLNLVSTEKILESQYVST